MDRLGGGPSVRKVSLRRCRPEARHQVVELMGGDPIGIVEVQPQFTVRYRKLGRRWRDLILRSVNRLKGRTCEQAQDGQRPTLATNT